jgi:FdhD protein
VGVSGNRTKETDALVVEEPLEIRVAGEPVSVTMRTPGNDPELAIGFLYAEGVIGSIGDVGRAVHCGRPGDEGFGNVIDVVPGPGVSLDVERAEVSRRGTLTTSACGVCGRASIEDLKELCEPVPGGPVVPTGRITRALESLRERQALFRETGALHAAAALTEPGDVLECFEDVGRHNAVDKVVGTLLRARVVGDGSPPGEGKPAILAVSGRISFEIVQKALRAQIPIVAGVSAATSLAVDLASAFGLTLIGFVRDGGFNVYAGPERIS